MKTLIACIGDDFLPGVKEAIQRTGCDILVQESLCASPIFHLGLNGMRNMAAMKAIEDNYDYVIFMDNDVLLVESQSLDKLISHQKDIIVPYLDYRGKAMRLTMPQLLWKDGGWMPTAEYNLEGMRQKDCVPRPQPDGLMALHWSVVSCIVFSQRALDVAGPMLFPVESIITAWDEYAGNSWRLQGLEIWQDLRTWVKLLRPPVMLWNKVAGKVDKE